jgi:hypothetical protein
MPPEMETQEQKDVTAATIVVPADPGMASQQTQQERVVIPTEDTESNDADQQQKKTVVELKHSEFKGIKEQAKKKGRQQAIAELNDKAKAAGFSSIDDAFSALAKLKATPTNGAPSREENMADKTKTPQNQQQRAANGSNGENRVSGKPGREVIRLRSERDKSNRKWRQEERRRRELQKKLDAKDAEMQLREAALLAGVTDTDYAMRLLSKELQNKTEEELSLFDERAYFQKLISDRPYLGKEVVVSATTGAANADAPPAPTSADVQQQTEATQFNARDAKPQDLETRLKQLGLNSHL